MNHYSEHPIVNVAVLVMETCTPLSIAQGGDDGLHDNLILRDANGCAAVSGSSFAGVLRHLYHRVIDDPATEQQLFGCAGGDSSNLDSMTQGSARLHLSWGHLHDSNDRPVVGLLLGEARQRLADPVLRDACQTAPVKRNRVRLDQRGSACDQGLFQRVALTAGHRFSFELSLRHDGEADEAWRQLLQLLRRPEFRLGGGTRSGMGALRVVRLHQACYDLRRSDDFARFGALSYDFEPAAEMRPLRLVAGDDEPQQIALKLTPDDGFRFGQGDVPLSGADAEGRQARLTAVSERRVLWDKGGGRLSERCLLIPASAVKGALRHRLAYHDRVLRRCFIDADAVSNGSADAGEAWPALDENPAVRELFGYARDSSESNDSSKSNDGGDGRAGRLLLDDLYLDIGRVVRRNHNGIDVFTGGVRNHVLYSEELVNPTLAFTLTVIEAEKLSTATQDAFKRTLTDLVEGRLALGAGAARGHGTFTGTQQWREALSTNQGGV